MSNDDPTIDYTNNVVKALNVKGYVGSIIVNPGGYSIPAGGISVAFTTQSTSLVCYKADGKTDAYVVEQGCKFDANEEVTMTGPDDKDQLTVKGASANTGIYTLSEGQL